MVYCHHGPHLATDCQVRSCEYVSPDTNQVIEIAEEDFESTFPLVWSVRLSSNSERELIPSGLETEVLCSFWMHGCCLTVNCRSHTLIERSMYVSHTRPASQNRHRRSKPYSEGSPPSSPSRSHTPLLQHITTQSFLLRSSSYGHSRSLKWPSVARLKCRSQCCRRMLSGTWTGIPPRWLLSCIVLA